MIAQSQNQTKFENMVQEMQKRIEEKNSEKMTPSTISKDIQAIKSQILGIDQKFEFFIDYINSYK